MKKTSLLITLSAFCLIFSCTKINEDFDASGIEMNSMEYNPEEEAVCLNCEAIAERNESSGEIETVLGRQITNPYSLEIMTQAYNNIYHQNVSLLEPTHKYIRVRPTDDEQLDQLEGEEDLVLSDYPLNYVVEIEGDYYPSAELAAGEEPWLYTVVPIDYQIPEGIEYELLEDVIVPDFNEPLEEEAYYLAGEMDDEELATYARVRTDIVDGDLLSPPCDIINMWSEENCTGYAGGGNGGSGYYPPNTNPQVPQGKFSTKMYVSNPNGTILSDLEPVRSVRIIGRRFLKHDRTYTDNSGNFKFSKNFPGKVHVLLEFHSPQNKLRIRRKERAVRAVKVDIGTYKGNLSNMPNYEFAKGGSTTANSTKNWIASLANNDYYKYTTYCNTNNLARWDGKLRISVTDVQRFFPNNIVPEFNPIDFSYSPMSNMGEGLDWWDAILTFGNPLVIWFVVDDHKENPDIVLYYGHIPIEKLTPSRISENIFYGLASTTLFYTPNFSTFQTDMYDNYAGNNSLLALYNAFSTHVGLTLTNEIYSTGSTAFKRQGTDWTSNTFASSDLQYLENFIPNLSTDVNSWIPQGLIHDLIDNSNETNQYIIDNVSGFTIRDIMIALETIPLSTSSTSQMPDFKNKLKLQKPNQATAIETLFNSYGY